MIINCYKKRVFYQIYKSNEHIFTFQLAERNIELEGTRARVRVLERLQQRPATETDADDESETNLNHNGLDTTNMSSSSAESSRDLLQSSPMESAVLLKPSPRRRPSRIPLPGATKATAPKPPTHRRPESRESLSGQLNKHGNVSLASTTTVNSTSNRFKSNRDSSRESLNKSTSLQSKGQGTVRSLPRSNNSLGKQTPNGSSNNNNSLSKPRDSLESNGGAQAPPSTPPRRPPAPARRSQAQVGGNGGPNQDASGKVRTVKQFFWTTWLK